MDACHRCVRTVDSLPIVTFDNAHLETLSIRLHTETGIYDFKMDAKTADGLRYLLGRALDPVSEHLVFPNPPSTLLPLGRLTVAALQVYAKPLRLRRPNIESTAASSSGGTLDWVSGLMATAITFNLMTV